jgi:hypothetical protein
MNEVEFNRRLFESLVAKLDRLDLLPEERELLLAIFEAAGARVSEARPEGAEEVRELHDQLRRAFLPESGEDFKLCPCRIT